MATGQPDRSSYVRESTTETGDPSYSSFVREFTTETGEPNYSSYVREIVSNHKPNRRKPKGHEVALERLIERAEDISTEALFLKYGGVQAWSIYFRLNESIKASNKNFSGKARNRQLLRGLEKTSVEFRISVAEGVKEALLYKAQRKRPPTTETADPADSVEESDDQRSISVKTAATETEDVTELINTVPDDSHLITDPPALRAEESDGQQGISAQTAVTEIKEVTELINTAPDDSRFLITDPPASRLSTIFPPLLAMAIEQKRVKSGWSAGITMSFLGNLYADTRFGPMMTLQTMSNLADRFAVPLFGTHIQSTEGRRALVLPGGTAVMANSELHLQGVDSAAVKSNIFVKSIN